MSRDFGSILRGDSGYSAQSSGGVIVLAQTAVAKAVTGTLVETELGRCIIPGGLLGPNGSLEIVPLFSLTNSVNNKIFKIKLGATQFFTSAQTAITSMSLFTVIRNRGVLNSQVSFAQGNTFGLGVTSAALMTGAIDTSVDQILTITGQLADITETITLEGYTVKILNPL